MVKADILTLIAEEQPRGVFDPQKETTRDVFCEVRSVGMNERYRAESLGLHPELVFRLSDYAEYQGEKLCEYQGERYRIVRTYVQAERIELTAERVVGYAE